MKTIEEWKIYWKKYKQRPDVKQANAARMRRYRKQNRQVVLLQKNQCPVCSLSLLPKFEQYHHNCPWYVKVNPTDPWRATLAVSIRRHMSYNATPAEISLSLGLPQAEVEKYW